MTQNINKKPINLSLYLHFFNIAKKLNIDINYEDSWENNEESEEELAEEYCIDINPSVFDIINNMQDAIDVQMYDMLKREVDGDIKRVIHKINKEREVIARGEKKLMYLNKKIKQKKIKKQNHNIPI
jgi:hypothetical protein